jgi:hypothetical protein
MKPSFFANNVAISVDTDTFVVGDADKLESTVFQQRPLHPAATCINTDAKKNNTLRHISFL